MFLNDELQSLWTGGCSFFEGAIPGFAWIDMTRLPVENVNSGPTEYKAAELTCMI